MNDTRYEDLEGWNVVVSTCCWEELMFVQASGEIGNWHMTPINDLKDHINKGTWCWCEPVIEDRIEGALVIHNAADGREFWEFENIELNEVPLAPREEQNVIKTQNSSRTNN